MIYGFDNFGYEGALVKVLADVRTGEGFDIVGLSDSAVKETKERCRDVLKVYGDDISIKRVLVSLEPADTRKCSVFDVSIALAILGNEFLDKISENVLVMGELDLSGKIRPVYGTFGACQNAISAGIKYAILPEGSAVPSGIKVCFVKDIRDAFYAYEKLGADDKFQEEKNEVSDKIEFSDILGKSFLDSVIPTNLMSEEKLNDYKFAMTVAVAGKHNLLVTGNGGFIRSLPDILPKLDSSEYSVINRIRNSFNTFNQDAVRPFRMPWHTSTIESMFGGGPHCTAGEINLAHNGVLFLDNAECFRTSVLQMLRVPITTGSVTLSRAGRSTVYPANFQLMMATKPCPCGNYGVKGKICLCSKLSLERYWQKFTVGLLDGMDIRFNCYSETKFTDKKMTLETMRELITNAWTMQKKRGKFNGKIKENCITDEWCSWFEDKSDYKAITGIDGYRKGVQIIMLARTLADMYGREKITHSDYITAKKLRADTILDEIIF